MKIMPVASPIKWLSGVLVLLLLSCGDTRTASLEVPSVSAMIRSPEGYSFKDKELRILWSCVEVSIFPMNPTGQRDCGGIGPKEGIQAIPIASDGSFVTSPISERRLSLARAPRFRMDYGVYDTNRTPGELTNPDYSRVFGRSESSDIAALVSQELLQLRMVRIRGGRYRANIKARYPDGSVVLLDDLMREYSESYNYSQSTVLWIAASPGRSPVAVSFEIVDNVLEIPDFEFMQVGSSPRIELTARVHVRIGLVKDQGQYKYYDDEVEYRGLYLDVTDDLETRMPEDFLSDLSIVLDID